jgi:hypothetical protein
VYAGPAEATALGNLLLQAVAAGDVSSIEAGRADIRRRSQVMRYQPR